MKEMSQLCIREVDSLFLPFSGRKLKLPTRLVMASVPRFLAQNGVPTGEMLRYYQRRAAHQLGLIITEPVAVNDPAAASDSGMAHFYGGAALRQWRRICRAVHATPSLIAPQLDHVGMLRPDSGDFPNPGSPPIGPSGIDPATGELRGGPMSRGRIKSVVAAFAESAAMAKRLGFDAVELNGANACLVEQFLRSETNKRDDEYGGDIRSRARFAMEIVHAMRKAAGRRFPIIFRFSQQGNGLWQAPLVHSPAELKLFLECMCDAGVDVFACDEAASPAFNGTFLDLPGLTRALTRRPVITSGGVGVHPGILNNVIRSLRNREIDLVAVGRALLADAEWGSKIRYANDEQIVPFTSMSWLHLY